MRIAYVINQYPKITHTFVRTEIAAVEQAGVVVERVAIRRADTPVLDPADRSEAPRTHVILDAGAAGLAAALLRTAARRPRRLAAALRMTLRMGWHSERGVVLHLAYLAEACVLLRWVGERRVDLEQTVDGVGDGGGLDPNGSEGESPERIGDGVGHLAKHFQARHEGGQFAQP